MSEQHSRNKLTTTVLAVTTGIIGVLWAVVNFLFPDPLVYFYGIWRPEYVLLISSAFIFLCAMSLFIWSYLKSKYLFFPIAFFVYVGSNFSFFIMGKEFYNAGYTDGRPNTTSHQGSLYHKGVEFSHRKCSREADSVICDLEVYNRRQHQKLSLGSFKLIMKDGAVYKDVDIFRGGQKVGTWNNLELPTGINAKVKVEFMEVDVLHHSILNLRFNVDNKEYSFNNIEIAQSTFN